MKKPILIANYDYEFYPWQHRKPYMPTYLLHQALKEFFTVYERDEIFVKDADVVLNMLPLVTKGGAGNDIFLTGKKTFFVDRVPFEHIGREYFPSCDHIFTSSPGFMKYYPQEKSSLLMDAADIKNYYYIPQPEGLSVDIVFLGNESGQWRKPLLAELEKHFTLLRFSGSDALGFPSANLLSQGRLNLGIFDMGWEGKPGIEYRTFLYGNIRPTLLHWNQDLLSVGFPHIHYIPYESVSDLIKVAKYYLKHEKEREEIGENAKRNLLKNHTYRNRAKQIFDTFQKI